MKTYPGIDYDFRPASYWDDTDPLLAILRNVKGTNRRAMIRDYWRAGMLEALDPVLLQDTLSSDERRGLGRIHPSFMGGEYLPDYRPGEIEIVRIELQSTTSDVISLRARLVGRRIGYRIVDEYPDDGGYVCSPKTSLRPLTLRVLIELLDEAEFNGGDLVGGVSLGFNHSNADGGCDRAELRHFTRLSSPFYPGLEEHYEHVFDDWVAEADEQGDDSREPDSAAGAATGA